MWIKICGLTSAQAVAAALDAGVDAIGFVLARSPRQLTAQAAAELARPARGRVRCVAVMRHPTQPEVDEMLSVFGPDLLQSDWGDFSSVRLPVTLEQLAVVHQGHEPGVLPARVLFEGAASGSGELSDWSAARALAARTELVLAGGLTAGNVAAGIAAVRPFGVDVSSGVEERLGIKSPAAIEKFVAAVRAADVAPGASRGST
jgi:phosphoribosylanthranilate isomerase